MPKGTVFVRAFNLVPGRLAHGAIKQVLVDHEEVIRFREYAYHITLQVEEVSSQKSLLSEIKERCRGIKIINSDYGNPYECWIDLDSFKISSSRDKTIITCLGHGIRKILHKK